jgi:hypothetical protein
MVLANNDLVKEDTFNARSVNWAELVNMDVNFRPTEYRTIRLTERMAEIEILIQAVYDKGNNYEATGKFYDDEKWYHVQIFIYKPQENAKIRFIPRPISVVTMFDQPYIEHCRKNRKKPSD